MKIHHYTSIETLALILKYKTIRFNRLDRVDDMEESMYGSGPTKIKLGQYVFVSCWTKDDLENISLWKMYKRQLASRSAARELRATVIPAKGRGMSGFDYITTRYNRAAARGINLMR